MTEISCPQCQEHTAELVLGVLTGRERADTLAHLQRCDRCQTDVAELAITAHRIVELLPDAEPPTGFEDRVLAAILASVATGTPAADPSVAARRALPPRLPVIARTPVVAAFLATILLVGGAVYAVAGLTKRPSSGPAGGRGVQRTVDVMTAPLLSGQLRVGTAYLFPDKPVRIVVSMSDADDPTTPTVNDLVSCDLVHNDGTTTVLGSFVLTAGHADWATDTPLNPDSLAGAQLTARVGHVVSVARFTPAPPVTPARAATPTTATAQTPSGQDGTESVKTPQASKPEAKAAKAHKAAKAPKSAKR